MIGECNCACMPAHNPFGRFDLFLYASPVSSCIGSPLWIPSKCSPTYTFTGLALTYFVPCIEFMNFVFVCFDSGLFFIFFSLPPFGLVTCPDPASLLKSRVPFFVIHLFMWLVLLFQSYAASLTRRVQMQNYPPQKIYIYSMCVQPAFLSSCLYRPIIRKKTRPHWA